MNIENMYLVLKIVALNESLSVLLNKGLNYKDIGELSEQAIVANYLELRENKLQLTDLGLKTYEELKNVLRKRNKKEWITKDNKNQIEKISINDIFLPSKDNLSF